MRDMTSGAPWRHLWHYALPLLLGNWLQLSYNAADTMIAGRFLGEQALAAEGIAGPVMNLVILAVSGLCIGAGVLMSVAFGARDGERLRRIMGTMLLFGSVLCCVVAGLGVLAAQPLLEALEVPKDILALTVSYLRVTFIGTPFTFFYNAVAAGLKSVGDSKTPLRFLAFSALLNGGLDLVFLGFFGFGILCSAVTTVFAEAASALLALRYLARQAPQLCPKREHLKPDGGLLAEILRYGGPTALQQTIQPVCKVLIQGQVNALGVSAIAAFNAVTRMDDFACIPCQGIGSAIATYLAQNRGAGKRERLRAGFRSGLRMELCYFFLIAGVTLLLRRPVVGLFVSGQGAEAVIELGSSYLGWMGLFYLFPAMTNGLQGFYRGMGNMYTTILATLLQASIRTVCVYWLVPDMGIRGVAFACAIGWSVMLLFEAPYYFYTCRRQQLPA